MSKELENEVETLNNNIDGMCKASNIEELVNIRDLAFQELSRIFFTKFRILRDAEESKKILNPKS